MRVLIVGDEPSKTNTYSEIAFVGAKCESRLNQWINYLGIEPDMINRTSKYFTLSIDHAIENNIPIIALGNKAETAVKKAGALYFKLPHPSGRNRQLNNKKFIEDKLLECAVWLNS